MDRLAGRGRGRDSDLVDLQVAGQRPLDKHRLGAGARVIAFVVSLEYVAPWRAAGRIGNHDDVEIAYRIAGGLERLLRPVACASRQPATVRQVTDEPVSLQVQERIARQID